jgi:hypothetical protein
MYMMMPTRMVLSRCREAPVLGLNAPEWRFSNHGMRQSTDPAQQHLSNLFRYACGRTVGPRHTSLPHRRNRQRVVTLQDHCCLVFLLIGTIIATRVVLLIQLSLIGSFMAISPRPDGKYELTRSAA